LRELGLDDRIILKWLFEKYQAKNDEMGGACSTLRGDEKYIQIFIEKSELKRGI
jgi:hypothetical protein